MSAVAVEARRLAAALLPGERSLAPPPLAEVETALGRLRSLKAVDGFDETALDEAEQMLLRLRDAAWEAAHRH